MSGSIQLSQFKNTTTLNNDLVLGNPRISSSLDHDTRYLVFQVSDQAGPAYNPHMKCTWTTPNTWTLSLGDQNGTPFNFAFIDANQTFTGNNIFGAGKTVTFNGITTFNQVTTFNNNINLGLTAGDLTTINSTLDAYSSARFRNTVRIDGEAHLYSNLIVDGTLAVTGTTTTIDSTITTIKDPLITLNTGTPINSYYCGIEINGPAGIEAYFKTNFNGTGWSLKTPANAYATTLSISNSAPVLLVLPDTSGTLALLSDIPVAGDPVTLDGVYGTSSGLGLVGQVLSLSMASSSTTGALSSTDWNTFNNKAPNTDLVHLSGNETITGLKTFTGSITTTDGSSTTQYNAAGATSFKSSDAAVASAYTYLGVNNTFSSTEYSLLQRNDTAQTLSLSLITTLTNGSSLILCDRTTTSRYELYLDSGVLTIGLAP